jgi:hypothetical protein
MTGTGLVIHPQTQQQINQFIVNPSHALLVVGPAGGGKESIMLHLVSQLLSKETAELVSYPYLHHITVPADKRTIGIEAVRELQHLAALKMPSAEQRRIVIIHDAHLLTGEAQNAILKLLEEPPANSHFFLTASDPQALLPTIRSRSQQFTVHRPSKPDLVHHFVEKGFDIKTVEQAYFMSGGLPGLMQAILDDGEHPLKTAAQTARQLLQSSLFERLCLVDSLSKSREQALSVLTVLRHMAQAAIDQSAQASATQPAEATTKRLKQWHKVLQASYDAEQAYAVSAQAKLTLDNLMLAI